MREQKFRARYVDSQIWVYFTIGEIWTDLGNEVYSKLCTDGKQFYQYTGLKDKNGKEIYEGDVVRQTLKSFSIVGGEYEVIWKDAGFSFIHAKRDGDKYGVFTRNLPLNGDIYEIIGNTEENPELLK